MATPAMALNSAIRNIFLSVWLMWTTSFMASRIYLLHEAYIQESSKRSDESWLLRQCDDPEFYSNMRQHTDLCTEVANNARSSLILKAIYKVASNTHLCGSSSCVEAAYTFVLRFGWQATLLVALIMIVAPNFVFAILRHVQQQRILKAKEESMMHSASCYYPPLYSGGDGKKDHEAVGFQHLASSTSMLRNRGHTNKPYIGNAIKML